MFLFWSNPIAPHRRDLKDPTFSSMLSTGAIDEKDNNKCKIKTGDF